MAAEIFAPSYLANFDSDIIGYTNQLFHGKSSGRGSHKFRCDRAMRYSLKDFLERVRDDFSLERYFSLLRSASPEETIEHFGDILRSRTQFLDFSNLNYSEPFEIFAKKNKHYCQSLVPLLQETLKNITAKYSKNGVQAFEVGIGTGAISSSVLEDTVIACGGSFSACDVKDYLAPKARGVLARFIQGDAQNVLRSEPSESIQIMLAINTFHHFTSLGKARRTLREIFRVLAPNGTLILVETTHKRSDIYGHLTNALLDLVMHDVTNLYLADNPAIRPFPCSLLFFSDEDLEEEILQFGNITTSCTLASLAEVPVRERFYIVNKQFQ